MLTRPEAATTTLRVPLSTGLTTAYRPAGDAAPRPVKTTLAPTALTTSPLARRTGATPGSGTPLHAPAPVPSNRTSEPTTAIQTGALRSEEHTSELQSPCNLVCRLLLEKKKTSCPPVAVYHE